MCARFGAGLSVRAAPILGRPIRGNAATRSTWDAHGLRARALHPVLPRKEVIQPHLTVRLPCYDFVPIAGPALDRSPPEGLGHGLQALPTFMT